MPHDLYLPAAGTYHAQSPKHAPIGAQVPAGDLRSVGELLVDADYHARKLLLDTEAAAAPGLLRSWSQTVAAATQLWHALPGVEYVPSERRRAVDRVSELADSLQADLATARWPGAGAGDHRMQAIAGNLTRAHELVDKYGADVPTHRPEVQADLEAARARVVHTLYIATHGVVVALAEDGRLRATDPTRTKALRAAAAHHRGRYEVGPGVRWADRLGVAERTLAAYLHPAHYAEALTGEQTAAAIGLPRLREALARFDIQAHRTLVDAPTAANLVLATRTEGMFFGAALAMTRAATETGHLERAGVDPARFKQGLTAAGEAWMGLARRWRDLMPQGARIDPALATAADQLRTACREITHNGDQIATPAVITARVDLAEALPVIAHYVDAAAELAQATRPALREPDLVAPSRAIARRLSKDLEEGLFPADVAPRHGDVAAIAARGDRLGPLPAPLVATVDRAAVRAGRLSTSAANLGLTSSRATFSGQRPPLPPRPGAEETGVPRPITEPRQPTSGGVGMRR